MQIDDGVGDMRGLAIESFAPKSSVELLEWYRNDSLFPLLSRYSTNEAYKIWGITPYREINSIPDAMRNQRSLEVGRMYVYIKRSKR